MTEHPVSAPRERAAPSFAGAAPSRLVLLLLWVSCALLPALGSPLAARATVEGRVTTSAGVPVEGARVELLDPQEKTPAGGPEGTTARELRVTTTDARGTFFFPEAEPPVQLVVLHPRFREQAVPVPRGVGPVEVTLAPKQEVYEEIVVSADRAGDSFSPVTITSTVVEPEDAVGPPTTLQEVVDGIPGVAENGQAGIFQVFSIRGISRQRILTLISGMQITSERRAGVSASFVDPLLMGSVDLLRGPSSSYYGSGALGGVVQVFPERYDEIFVQGGYDSAGDETYQMVGWGRGEAGDRSGGLSVAVAHRRSGNAEDPTGTEINSHFEQTSATVRKSWQTEGGRSFELLAIPTRGTDIGKANTDFPERTTNYPEEEHFLLKLTVRDERWRAYAWAHPHELETDTRRTDSRGDTVQRNTVFNDTLDLGANFQREISLGQLYDGRVGLDWFGRRSVDARELERVPGEEVRTFESLSGGEQDEVAAYGSLRRRIGLASVEAGSRFTWLRQQNGGRSSLTDSAWNGFLGAVVPLGGGFELAANVGTGLRFPNLSERFFTGTTGRGEILSNEDLSAERSLSTDLRLRWFGERLFVEVDAFVNEIDDYIERVEVEEDVLTFVNLTSGRLEGLETEGFYELRPGLRLLWGGHAIDGEDNAGQPLSDVPPDRFFIGLRKDPARASSAGGGRNGSPWSWAGRLELRDELDDPGSGERAIPSATLLSASVGYRVRPGLRLNLTADNLLDEEYFSSADDKAPLAPGRSVGLSFRWRP